MTVIMGASFVAGVAIAGDTLLHEPGTMSKVMNSAKTMVVANRVAIAQAGQFTGTQPVWRELEKLDPSAVTPQLVADCILAHAGAINADKVTNGGSLETWYLVGGLEQDGTPVIICMAIHRNEVQRFTGPGQIIAIGTQADATDRATVALKASLKSLSNVAELDTWVRKVVAGEAAASPQAVGFPATLVVIRRDNAIEANLDEAGVHHELLEGFFP